MTHSEALAVAQEEPSTGKFTGTIEMANWTLRLPDWAFKLSLDFSLMGLRRDLLVHWKENKK